VGARFSGITFQLATSGIDRVEDQVVTAYLGIIEVSLEYILLDSLSDAVRDRNIFAVRGEGPLFFETQQALAQIEQWLHEHPKSAAQVRTKILEGLEVYSPDRVQQQRTRQIKAQSRVSTVPFRSVYPLPFVFPQAAGGGYSPDGKYLVVISGQGAIQTFTLTGGPLASLYTQPAVAPSANAYNLWLGLEVYPLVFSPDGKKFSFNVKLFSDPGHSGPFLHRLRDGGLLGQFQTAAGRGANVPPSKDVRNLTFSPDGKYLGMGAAGVSNYLTPEALWKLDDHTSPMGRMTRFPSGASATFSSDGRYYANAAGGLHLYDLSLGAELLTPIPRGENEDDEAHMGRSIDESLEDVNEVAMHPTLPLLFLQQHTIGKGRQIDVLDMSQLPSGYLSKTARLDDYNSVMSLDWDFGERPVQYVRKTVLRRRNLSTIPDPGGATFHGTGLLWSKDGKYLVSASVNTNWGLLHQPPTSFQIKEKPRQAAIDVFEFSNASGRGILVRDLASVVTTQPRKMRFSRDGKYFLILDSLGILSAFQLPDFSLIATVGSEQAKIWDFDISPNSERIFTIEEQGSPRERNFMPVKP